MVLPLLAAGAAWFGVPAVLNVVGFGGGGIVGGSIAALVQVHFFNNENSIIILH